MSLRLSLILGIFALVLATFILGATMIYANAVGKVETEMSAAVDVGGRMMKRAVANIGAPYSGREVLERLVSNFDGDRHLQAVVIGEHGTVQFSSTPAQPKEPAPDWFVRLIDVPKKSQSVELPPAFSGVGSLVIQSTPRNEISEVWEDATKLFFTLGLLGLTILTMVYLHVTRALQPLGGLAQALSKVGDTKSSLARIPEQGPSELMAVCRGFNDMLDRLDRAEAQNRRLNQQLEEVQEEERAELARDLHDEIGPLLFAVDVDAAAIERQAGRDDDPVLKEKITGIREGVARLRGSVKELLGRLRPAVLIDLGLSYAINNQVAFWRGRHPELTIETRLMNEDFGERFNAVIYRIVQEGLSNAVRHGKPRNIDVIVQPSPGSQDIDVIVRDDGSGIDPAIGYGFGLSGMAERVAALGGTLDIGPSTTTATGVELHARLPLSASIDLKSQRPEEMMADT